jgi:hypothetical protein
VDDEGDPVSGAKVSIFFGIMTGNDSAYTNDDGWVEFSYDSIDDSRLWVTDLYINSVRVAGEYYLDDGETESYARPD